MFPMQRTRSPWVPPLAALAAPKPPCASGTCRKSRGARRGRSSSSGRGRGATFLPADAVPQRPDGANEPREGDEEEEGEALGGVEESKRELFR